MLTKEYGQTNAFMSIMLMTKVTLDMWMWGRFHNRSSVIEVEKMCGRNETKSKRKRPKFLIALEDFLYKVRIVQ